MNIDGVFSGGGVKAIAFIGALKVVEEKGYKFDRVAGTSAGAIIAAFIAAGYSSAQIRNFFDTLQLDKLLDPPMMGNWFPFSKWLSLYFRLGINKGQKLEDWIYEELGKQNIYTFKDLPEGSLKVIASDLTLGRMVVIPDDLERLYGIDPNHFSVAKAVRISAGLPYFFIPERLQGKSTVKSVMVDGGLLSNFPIWVFTSPNERRIRPILGMKLSTSTDNIPPRKIKNAIEMFQALFSTMKKAHDARHISKAEAVDIIFIPVEDVDTTDFDMSDEQKQKLITLGEIQADLFLRSWLP
ncbi:patatin-like phospholipase family protein [Pontibacillus salicampi]|uniref:Patatin-like phospholipase family protein n=1 Tax=Pontibacillus salicampi TaxID=1449801 RepID=A0ABV6LK13_9BACI